MEDMIFIINRYLLNPNFTGRGVCIVGMSGIGKSTLARYIQYDTAVIEKFTSISWASVGSDLSSPANLVFQNQGHVADGYPVKKYRLLVLDDLWSVQPMAWDKFQSNFGSETIFLITTRDPKVAIVTDTTAYFIERLSDEDCNELIMTDLPQTLSDHQYCRSIFHIARKCAGLPLMAYWLNLLIKFKYREEGADAAISYLEESDLWELKEFRDEIFPALRFDRPPMPPEMGKFIAYLCLFPEGHYFKKDELTLLWMAEGFLRPEKWTALNLKDAGKHFDDILSRSMFYFSLCSSASSEDKTATYEIHEFTRRFAQDIASNMCYQMDSNDKAYYLPAHKIRHLSLGCQALVLHQTLIETYYSKLRTILLLSGKGNNITGVPESFFQKLHLLRVVSLSHSHITTLPRSIGNLKHLRYLDASSTPIQSLPDATCKLFALRVLNLKNCPNLLRLPSDIGNLVNLFHLEVDMARLSSLPRCIGLLTNLQTLEVFTVYNTQGYRITELKNMNNLRGSIKIKNLENVDKASEAKNAKLCLKSYLKRLELHWSRQSSMPEPLVTNILGMLQPHNNLTELQLTNYSGDAFPSWISSPSCRLQVIHLYNCLHITELPPFWKLQDLKSLSINTACSLAQLDREFFGDLEQRRFPQLVSLELQNMKKLARWGKLEPGDMPSLLKLKISGCPVLSNLPNFRFFTSLKVEIIRCPSLKVPKFPPSVLVRIIN